MLDFPQDITLIGEFHCSLTNAEANQFRTHIETNKVYTEYSELLIDIRATELALQGGCYNTCFDKLKQYYRRQSILLKELWQISMKWYEDVILPQREKEREARLNKKSE